LNDMAKKYWLMKSEPGDFSIDDLKSSPKKTAHWDGVRNYQARNFMRDQMQLGDGVLFYHSVTDPSVVGTATVVKTAYPDHTAWDKKSKYYDPKSPKDNPRWFMVEIKLDRKFKRPLALGELRGVKGLEKMVLLKKGSRLSVQPVSAAEWYRLGCELRDAEPERAAQALERALALDPKHAEAHVDLGCLRHAAGALGDAEAHYRAALAEHPTDATARFDLAVVLEDHGRETEARAEYERTLLADPACADAHYNLARLCERAGDEAGVIRHLLAYRRLAPDS